MTMHSTRVRIVGEEYTIRSEVSPEVTRAIDMRVYRGKRADRDHQEASGDAE